jgi:hypothetical protein
VLEDLRRVRAWRIHPPSARSVRTPRQGLDTLKAGIAVPRRKTIGRLCDWNQAQSFAAIAVTKPA